MRKRQGEPARRLESGLLLLLGEERGLLSRAAVCNRALLPNGYDVYGNCFSVDWAEL